MVPLKEPWKLSQEDMEEIVDITSGISLPARCTAKVKNDFIMNRQGMKTVDLIAVLCSGVLKVLLRGRLPHHIRTTVFKLLDCFQNMSGEDFTSEQLTDLELEMQESLALLELKMPLALQVLSFHLRHHVSEALQMYGTMSSMWMAYLERYNYYLTSMIQNYRHPEQSIMSTYQLAEFGGYTLMTRDCGHSPVMDALIQLEAEIQQHTQVNMYIQNMAKVILYYHAG